MKQWVDQTWDQNATLYSMTDYFNQMSLNKLKLTGKVVSVITPRTRQLLTLLHPNNNNKALLAVLIADHY